MIPSRSPICFGDTTCPVPRWALRCIAILACCSGCVAARAQGGAIELGAARLTINNRGAVSEMRFRDGTSWATSSQPVFAIETLSGIYEPAAVQVATTSVLAKFTDGSTARFSLSTHPGFALFRLLSLSSPETVERLHLFQVQPPAAARVSNVLNAGFSGGHAVAVQALEPNVHAFPETSGSSMQNRDGCTQDFMLEPSALVGKHSARYRATCNDAPSGWTMRQSSLPKSLDLRGCTAIRAWVTGDGSGASLKFQLQDGKGGCLDLYTPINFTGTRQLTLTAPAASTLDHIRVAALAIYYNGLPAKRAVTCVIDQVEAVLQETGGATTTTVLLEDFENPRSPWWHPRALALKAETLRRYSVQPAAFGVIACNETEFMATMERFERAAGLPSPRFEGSWMRQSPAIQRSYLFLTDFGESQFDAALALAKRGGFGMVLLEQGSWTRASGHYEINRGKFPEGQAALTRTVQRFQQAGLGCGLHFLAASIYPPDAYLTPVPDPRLVKPTSVKLAADVEAQADFLPVEAPPDLFPAEDGGYKGQGAVLQCGNELITYASRSTTPPYGFAGCRRGHLGTAAAAHARGEPVFHLLRAYDYHLFDMDTSLLDEVATNLARVANASNVDMLYFDGSERLQGDHWYYNARLHKAFHDRLRRKDILMQASSYSHYSWHLLARGASADGHGDLKGYLDERSPVFAWMANNGMPLDIGWYYGYDHGSTPDEYEYVLGATIGHEASVSFQVSVAAAATHPFTGEILDLIKRYERLRLSGRVPPEMRERLRIAPSLGGEMPAEERARKLAARKEYRLVGAAGHEAFQRMRYEPWRELDAGTDGLSWDMNVLEGPARVGFQVHARPGLRRAAGSSYTTTTALAMEGFEDLAGYGRPPATGPMVTLPASAYGVTNQGVTQEVRLAAEGAREGRRGLVYTATSTRSDAGGWSCFGRRFSPPLDLSWCQGLGLWMRGDGKGGLLKVQLLSGSNALDHYIKNDYTGWAYHQLPRKPTDAIDYGVVTALNFYYNALPASTTVSCAIDGVKALAGLDNEAVVNPWFEVDGQRVAWPGKLEQGQYVFLWPGEKPIRYGQPLREPEVAGDAVPVVNMPAGRRRVTFGVSRPLATPARVRVTLQPPERWPIGAP